MALLQPRLNLKVAQRQILTPGLMQMVSVLALNKLELKEMINAEIVENPVLEEMEESVPLLDDMQEREQQREQGPAEASAAETTPQERDPFDEIDFGSYFQDYLDPGFRTPNSFEISDKPSFESFLSQPETLTKHLMWQLGSLNLTPDLREAAEYIIGNLDEDGYLLATDEELLDGYLRELHGQRHNPAHDPASAAECIARAVGVVRKLDPCGIATRDLRECLLAQIEMHLSGLPSPAERSTSAIMPTEDAATPAELPQLASSPLVIEDNRVGNGRVHRPVRDEEAEGHREITAELLACAALVVRQALPLLLRRDLGELAKAIERTASQTQHAVEFIRTLDPRPGQRYNRCEARLIEPDVAVVKRGDDFVVVMNEEDLPSLRLNQGYRKLLTQEGTEREVKEYVKERYRSALQLIRNIEQRKSTILRTCEAIVRRQPEFLESGVEALKPMMIKDVAEEIGVHPSTVSRAVSNKYVHTPQGVFELRFFFSEGVNGPEGASTPLMLLKRKVKKFIEEEDPKKPLTDDLIASYAERAGHRGDPAHRGQVPRRYAHSQHAPAPHS